MEDIAYRGYMIDSRAWALPDGRYAASGLVYRDVGDTTRSQAFEVAGSFISEDEALRAAIELGKALVDGRHPGLAI